MSHEVETMAFAHETPWHGLGNRVDETLTHKEMLVAAGLDWSVSKRPMSFQAADGRRVELPGQYQLVRDSDDQPLSPVGSRYKPVQNEEALRFFERFIEAGQAKLETAGSLRKGKVVWCLANLGHGFTLPGGDTVKGYLLLASPHEGGKSLMARTTPVRVVCANTMAMALSEKAKFEQRFSHAREFDADEAAETFGLVHEQMTEYERNARLLQKLNLSAEDAIRVLAPVYQPQAQAEELVRDEKLWSPTIRSVIDAYARAPGATSGTAWGLINGATYHSNHRATPEKDARLASAWFGTEAKRQQQLMTNLVEMAG